MTETAHYPEASKIADDHISKQVSSVRDEVVRLADRQERYNDKLDARFDSMVTRAEFRAEIGRVDAERGALSKEVTGVKDAIKTGFDEVKQQGEARGAKSRWFTGIVMTGAGLASGLVFNILGSLPK